MAMMKKFSKGKQELYDFIWSKDDTHINFVNMCIREGKKHFECEFIFLRGTFTLIKESETSFRINGEDSYENVKVIGDSKDKVWGLLCVMIDQ